MATTSASISSPSPGAIRRLAGLTRLMDRADRRLRQALHDGAPEIAVRADAELRCARAAADHLHWHAQRHRDA